MPTLFIQAEYDTVCDTVNSPLAEASRKRSKNLTEASVAAGHWLALEKPAEVNSIIEKWIKESCNVGNVKSKV